MDIVIDGLDGLVEDFESMPDAVQRAAVRSMNRGLVSAETLGVTLISRYLGARERDVKKKMTRQPATFGHPTARIGASLKGLPLIGFGATGPRPSRGRGRGVTFTLDNKRQNLRHAFIAQMRSGHVGVFQRVGSGDHKSRGAWSKNLPIEEKFGPSIGTVFNRYRGEMIEAFHESFDKNFLHEQLFQENRRAGN